MQKQAQRIEYLVKCKSPSYFHVIESLEAQHRAPWGVRHECRVHVSRRVRAREGLRVDAECLQHAAARLSARRGIELREVEDGDALVAVVLRVMINFSQYSS